MKTKYLLSLLFISHLIIFAQNPSQITYGINTLTGTVILEDLVSPHDNHIIKNAEVLKLPRKILVKGQSEGEGDAYTDEIRIYGDLNNPNGLDKYKILVNKYVTVRANLEFGFTDYYPLDVNITSDFTYTILRNAYNEVPTETIKMHNFFVNSGCKILAHCAHPLNSLDWYTCDVQQNNIAINLYFSDNTHTKMIISRGDNIPFSNLSVTDDNTGTRPFILIKPIAQMAINYAESYDKNNVIAGILEKVLDAATDKWTGADWTVCIMDLCYKM